MCPGTGMHVRQYRSSLADYMNHMAPKKSTARKTTPAKRVTKKVTEVAKIIASAVSGTPEAPARGTWASVVDDKIDAVMKKPRSWADWSARQLRDNRQK